MAALVTLEKAKSQLRVTSDDDNDAIQDAIEDASAIILDYLKSRANKTATILTSSVASPTVVTTDGDHTFVNGETVVITDHADSTPALDGTYVVSNVTADSFTVPVAITVAGTGGLATVAWTQDTAPGPVRRATLLMIAHFYEHRGDDQKADAELWAAIERILMRSRDPALA